MWNKIYEEENDYQRKRMIFLTIFIYFTSFHTQNETNILFITIITTKQYIWIKNIIDKNNRLILLFLIKFYIFAILLIKWVPKELMLTVLLYSLSPPYLYYFSLLLDTQYIITIFLVTFYLYSTISIISTLKIRLLSI